MFSTLFWGLKDTLGQWRKRKLFFRNVLLVNVIFMFFNESGQCYIYMANMVEIARPYDLCLSSCLLLFILLLVL